MERASGRCGALWCRSNLVVADQENRTCGGKIFCQISGKIARECEIRGRRTLPAFRYLGYEAVVLLEILLGEQSDFPEAANVVREAGGIGRCRNDTQIVGRGLVVSPARTVAARCDAEEVLSSLGLGRKKLCVG